MDNIFDIVEKHEELGEELQLSEEESTHKLEQFKQDMADKYGDGTLLYRTAMAYADNVDPDAGSLRDLDWKGDFTNAEEFLKQAQIVGSYNDFDVHVAEYLVDTFPDSKFALGREGSVVVYIQSVPDSMIENGEFIEKDMADEADLEEDGTLRLWWD